MRIEASRKRPGTKCLQYRNARPAPAHARRRRCGPRREPNMLAADRLDRVFQRPAPRRHCLDCSRRMARRHIRWSAVAGHQVSRMAASAGAAQKILRFIGALPARCSSRIAMRLLAGNREAIVEQLRPRLNHQPVRSAGLSARRLASIPISHHAPGNGEQPVNMAKYFPRSLVPVDRASASRFWRRRSRLDRFAGELQLARSSAPSPAPSDRRERRRRRADRPRSSHR